MRRLMKISVIGAVWVTGICGFAAANSDDLTAENLSPKKAAVAEEMAKIRDEMAAMKEDLAREQSNVRQAAGGAPESWQSVGGATVRIGGAMRTQYGIGFASDYRGEGNQQNYRTTHSGWAIPEVSLNFAIDLSADVTGYIKLRWDGDGTAGWNNSALIQNAYWEWRNVGGGNYTMKIGLVDVPFGMYGNTDIGGYDYAGSDSAMIVKPLLVDDYHSPAGMQTIYMRDKSPTSIGNANLGVFTSHTWGDNVLVLRAGVMASEANSLALAGNRLNDPGRNSKNEARSLSFTNHVLALAYNPSWTDGLHLEISYLGRLDESKGIQENNFAYDGANGYSGFGTPYGTASLNSTQINALPHGDSSYSPSVALGGTYQATDRLKLYAETAMTWKPHYIYGFAWGAILGADYKLTDRLLVGASAEYFNTEFASSPSINSFSALDWWRLNIGARYKFNNGIYTKAQYYHDFYQMNGVGDGNWKDADVIMLETGYEF